MVKYSYRLIVKFLLKELKEPFVIFGMQNSHGKGKEALWVKIRKAPCLLQVALIHPCDVNFCWSSYTGSPSEI
jgi:hypothetical protein